MTRAAPTQRHDHEKQQIAISANRSERPQCMYKINLAIVSDAEPKSSQRKSVNKKWKRCDEVCLRSKHHDCRIASPCATARIKSMSSGTSLRTQTQTALLAKSRKDCQRQREVGGPPEGSESQTLPCLWWVLAHAASDHYLTRHV